MKSRYIIGIALAALMVFNTAQARDSVHRFAVAEPMATSTAEEFTNVRFYFGDQPHPTVARTIGEFTTRRTTNAFTKSDKEACDWGFLSAVKTLWERALKEGGNAVINIRSVTTGETVSSTEEYVCRAGNVVAKVYLEGTIVVLE